MYVNAGLQVRLCSKKMTKKSTPDSNLYVKFYLVVLFHTKKNNNVDDFDIECNILETAIFYLAFIVITKMKKVGTIRSVEIVRSYHSYLVTLGSNVRSRA